MKKLLLYFVLIFILFVNLKSWEANDSLILGSKYGILFNYDYNMHSVDLRQLPSVPDIIPRSATGNQFGLTFGLFYEYKFSARTSTMFRLIYSNHKAEIQGQTPAGLILNGQDTSGWESHTLKSDLSNIKIEPLLKYNLFKYFSFLGGLSFGLRFDKSFTHDEDIIELTGATFKDGLIHRSGIDTDYKDKLGLQAAIVMGFSYDIPLNFNGKYLLTLEALSETGFSDITNSITWDVNSYRFGFNLRYSENPTIIPEIEKQYEYKFYIDTLNMISSEFKERKVSSGYERKTYDTVLKNYDLIITENTFRTDTLFIPKKKKIEKPKPPKTKKQIQIANCFKFFVVGADEQAEYPKFKLRVEEFQSTSIKPLLNYIFFGDNSSIIPSRYNFLKEQETKLFRIKDLYHLSTLRTYYNILNIIGKRLRDNPKAKITLTGCNSGIEQEKDNLELSRKRANAVKNYLVNIWSIEPNRIKIKARNLPEQKSNSNNIDGIEENRRVEITSDNPDITSPVIANDVIRDVKPPQVRFYSNTDSCLKISKWSLDIYQDKKGLIGFKGDNRMPERIIWRLNQTDQTIPKSSSPVQYHLKVYDLIGKEQINISGNIDVKQITIKEKHLNNEGDKRIDKYSLIIFDYNKSTLNLRNKKIMDFIKKKIQSNSKVFVYGYTDRTGDDNYNLSLSERRAKAVAGQISETKNITYKGIGENDLIYSNELPEGRFYCRTVKIRVETPVKK